LVTSLALLVVCCLLRLLKGMHVPPQHIGECWNAAEFFANKLFKELRGVIDSTVAWVKALKVRLSCSSPT